MITLMIVDDEPIEREAIRFMVQTTFSQIEIVGEASNGFEAIKLYHETHPDIIIMDIQMPAMDGLEVIEEINKLNSQVKFIVITSYSRFEYAQMAVKLGVEDFLVKPARVDDITKTITKIVKQLEELHESSLERNRLEDKMQAMQELLEKNLMNAIKEGVSNEEIEELFELLQISHVESYVCIISDKRPLSAIIDRISLQIKRLGFREIHEYRDNQCTFIIINEHSEKNLMHKELTSYIENYFQGQGYYDLRLFVGGVVKSATSLPLSFKEAYYCYMQRSSYPSEKTLFYGEISEHVASESKYLPEAVKRLIPSIISGNIESIRTIYSGFFESSLVAAEGNSSTLFLDNQHLVSMVMQKISYEFPLYNVKQQEIFNHSVVEEPLSHEKIFEHTYSLLEKTSQVMMTIRETLNNPLYAKVIKFLDSNYEKNISLESLATEFGISPYYIGRIIKVASDSTFNEYLTQVRIQKSKELLKEGKLSIKEISFSIGFNSQQYFSRVFKKYVGLTPSEYVRSL